MAGASGIVTTIAVALFSLDKIPQVSSLRTQYPMAMYGAWLLNLTVVYATFRPILFFALVVLVPIVFWIVHASMRSRGLKNKISNKMEQLGAQVYANTPMELVLNSLGIEAKDFEE